MKKTLAYLACPYFHQDRAIRVARFEAANRVAARLMSQGEHIFSPISHTHPIAEAGDLPLGWDFWADYDEAIISCCYRIYVLMLDGWKESRGVGAELDLANEYDIEVVYLGEDGCVVSSRSCKATVVVDEVRLIIDLDRDEPEIETFIWSPPAVSNEIARVSLRELLADAIRVYGEPETAADPDQELLDIIEKDKARLRRLAEILQEAVAAAWAAEVVLDRYLCSPPHTDDPGVVEGCSG